MSDNLSDQKPVRTGLKARLTLAFVSLMTMLAVLVPGAAAITMDFNGIAVVIGNVTDVILPQLLNLVIGALPIIVVLAVVGFIVAFLDRILGMIKF